MTESKSVVAWASSGWEHKELWGMMEMFCIFMVVEVPQVYTFVKSH